MVPDTRRIDGRAVRMDGCLARITCGTAGMHRRPGPLHSRTAPIAARIARMNTRTPRMHTRLAQRYGCHAGTLASRAGMHARTAGLHGRTGAIVARHAATRHVTAVLSLAHEQMSRRTGHRTGAAGRMSIKTDGSHGTAEAFSGSPTTSHSRLKMLITLSLRARPPPLQPSVLRAT